MITPRQREVANEFRSRGWWIMNRVERFEYNKTPIADGDCPDDIVFLSLSFRSEINDEWLRLIAELTDLVSLHIDATCVTDAGIAELLPLRQLTCLNLRDTVLTDRSIAIIAEFPNLEYLWLNSTQVAGTSLMELKRLQDLTNLFLGENAIKDDFIRKLSLVNSLEYLSISNTETSDDTLAVLCKMPNLRFIDVAGTQVTESSADELRRLHPHLHIDTFDY